MLDGPDEDGEGVLSEKSPFEPDEFDPSSLGPDVPEAPSPPEGAANNDVTALFWKLVVVFNVALLALSVGPMIAYFEGDVDLGVRITLVGAIAAAYGYFRYRRFTKQRDSDDAAEDGAPADGGEPDHNG
ncbi:hypothetical protein NDI56_00765 [Haloarcula sp. S1CR25-12]|uniref:DUF7322 domain-containing protein n=1 Tax=Haloarcula saliterrae TaxID=2950534 RepID=A0ABU2F6P5_9EURY|nr:hypothetical protein [Haloarcula sp. S1CR25-12]MDS0257934.1 hypothetical protein [Haloarcula sp. S1CR25-12]